MRLNYDFGHLVSFPRTGQNYLIDMISRVLDFEPYAEHYCELYSCCNQTPCKLGKKLQKNHDFDFDVGVKPEHAYLACSRHPLPALFSYFLHEAKHNNGNINFNGEDVPANEELWLPYLRQRLNHWNKFTKKWIDLSQNQNVKFVWYEDIIQKKSAIKDVFDFLFLEFDRVRFEIEFEKQSRYVNNQTTLGEQSSLVQNALTNPKANHLSFLSKFPYSIDASLEIVNANINSSLAKAIPDLQL